jgi:transcriptional regulator with XRE-family HTH domain
MTVTIYLAQNLRLLRKLRRCTQAEVAAAVGLRRTTIANYETGVSRPGYAQLLLLARYYNISADTLLSVALTGAPHELLWMGGEACADTLGMLQGLHQETLQIKAHLKEARPAASYP